MSYVRPNTGDSLNDYFSDLSQFMNIVPNLMKATDERTFEVWFEKLWVIDRRTLRLYLQKHKVEIDPKFYSYVNLRYGKQIL